MKVNAPSTAHSGGGGEVGEGGGGGKRGGDRGGGGGGGHVIGPVRTWELEVPSDAA